MARRPVLEITNAHVYLLNETAGCFYAKGVPRPIYVDSSIAPMPLLGEFGTLEVIEDSEGDLVLHSFTKQEITKEVKVVRKKIDEEEAQTKEDIRGISKAIGRALCLILIAANAPSSVEDDAIAAMDDAMEELADRLIDFAMED